MKKNVDFPKSFLSICLGITIVLSALSLFMYSVNSSYAETPRMSPLNTSGIPQVGTAENYIPITIKDGYAYWLIFNVTDGYKFRKSPINGDHWGSRTE
jgi:hypothetical protein